MTMSRKSVAVAALGILILAASLPALAMGSDNEISLKVPFQFVVSGKTFPEGDYRVVRDPKGMPELKIQSADGKHSAALMAVTRLARQHTGDAPTGSVVFDKTANGHFLSEVWMPGQDGYLLKGESSQHTHEILEVKN